MGAFFVCLCGNQTLCAQRQTPKPNLTVLLNNYMRLVPLRDLGDRNIAYIGHLTIPAFATVGNMLERYAPIRHFMVPEDVGMYHDLDEQLKYYNTLILGLAASDLGNKRLLQFIATQAVSKQLILTVFGTGAKLQALDFVQYPILWNPELSETAARNTAMSVFGGIACTARLPQSFSARYATGGGFTTEQIRLEYTNAAALGIDALRLEAAIDTIAQEAIRERATPGAVVLVAKGGKVIFEKAYGHHTYTNSIPTKVSDLFDLASLTKITATTPTIMRLVERGIINLDSTMGHYLLQAQPTNKNHTKLRDVMLHEAGFIPFIPFYRELKPDDLSTDSSAVYSVKVADGCYIRTGYYQNVMWPTMLYSKLNTPGTYVYSDISMYVMKEVAEHQTGIPIQDYIQLEFYRPLGMQTAGYLPRLRFPKGRIVPTEDDKTFRKTLLQGYVHDQGAAMAGGIAGHAGMFATANDLAIYGQLLLNRGEYGGDRYFKGETVDLFTSRQSATSRRGLGFDRWDPDTTKHYPSKWASDATFGHTGYTGTCIWIDPKEQLTYIFLSNRVHPAVSTKLSTLNIRGRIQDAVYEAIYSAK
ncbi:CubicO group peptidase, beta-lactamase class C family [Parapedobacter indicus]|uniref:CubicO group peptidase, beta-lactamase class C family n=2 Tax=Parapedobacter indicus TaxID=1477437 RepID=A0A1I3KWZ6_9SPHI|nr:CubicO group peptidase (beta-lactamase class C family) [Parapedobacter indicus]SFI76625.1 CubicO group peptidase, beta-lactamase class C family [Parapedobacter indicus]